MRLCIHLLIDFLIIKGFMTIYIAIQNKDIYLNGSS